VTATPPEDWLPVIVGISTAATLLVIAAVGLAIFIICRQRANRGPTGDGEPGTGLRDVSALLDDFNDYFLLAGVPQKKWDIHQGKSHHQLLQPNSEAYQTVLGLFNALNGTPLADAISAIYGVINPQVATNFLSHRSILARRLEKDPNLFKKEDWRKDSQLDLRQWTMHQFGDLAQSSPWNTIDELVPVVPMVHGTDATVAWKILDTGFSALSSLDKGYYGCGIYFTSSAQYALPYYSTKKNPAVLICLAIPGNVYPVTEHRKGENSLMGQPIKGGYQSHYVLTTKDGNPCKQREAPDSHYDELVLGQEAQVVPIAIIEFSQDKLIPFAKAFQREIPTHDQYR